MKNLMQNALSMGEQELESVTQKVESVQEGLFAKANVVGFGLGLKNDDPGTPAVKVLVSQKLPPELLRKSDLIDPSLADLPTDVEEVGELLAGRGDEGQLAPADAPQTQHRSPYDLGGSTPIGVPRELLGADTQALANRVRPVEGGYSVAHYRVTAGTMATAVYDKASFPGNPPRYYMLSNNHVLANSNDARVGDPILQPGPYDGGTYPRDQVARLSRWVPIRFGGPDNLVDAAIAEGSFNVLDREIYWIGYVKGVRTNWPTIGEVLQKTGRTTHYTTGSVTAINATVTVGYGAKGSARFVRQIVTRDMSDPGDSGSLVLDMNENAIGLLFAGSATHTILNHIYYVQSLLGIKLD